MEQPLVINAGLFVLHLSLISTPDSTFPNSDFTSNSATLTFPAGSGPLTSQTFIVQVMDDDFVEGTETIPLQATVVGGVAVGTFTADRDTADIEIIDDDGKYVMNIQLVRN